MNNNLVKAAKEILHLHLCEQEGLSSGQPTREQWLTAVDNLSAALNEKEVPQSSLVKALEVMVKAANDHLCVIKQSGINEELDITESKLQDALEEGRLALSSHTEQGEEVEALAAKYALREDCRGHKSMSSEAYDGFIAGYEAAFQFKSSQGEVNEGKEEKL